MRRPFVAGNWKLNGSIDSTRSLIAEILGGLAAVADVEVALCPPYLYIPEAAALLLRSAVALGSQNASEFESGAYTGEISAPMLKQFGCRYVILGHSERRAIFGETDTGVAKKVAAVAKHGLTPILCVGELLSEREADKTETVVGRQLDAVLDHGGIELLAHCVIAYEPVWAIGTGKTASPDQAQEVHAFIRGRLQKLSRTIAAKLRIIYGGSVKPDNAEELFAKADIDGGLIGGASLDGKSFLAICRGACNKV